MRRRTFIQISWGMAGALAACSSPKKKIKGSIVGAASPVGHLLRENKFPPPSQTIKKQTVIVGGGVSGLSAARALAAANNDFILLELENHTGGNSAYGENKISAFPWGAHYVPLPNNDLSGYASFLQECGVITGYAKNGLPEYKEEYICFNPQERLYINGRWQEGLVPDYGVSTEERKQTAQFLLAMNDFRNKTGSDGKAAFAIPVNNSSTDEVFTRLDGLTMQQWMQQNGFTAASLNEYVNYCCRDDFGTPHHQVSAWAGIHYFAGRKGKAANADSSDVLTWPEGNGFLVKALEEKSASRIKRNALVFNVNNIAGGVTADYLDVLTNLVTRVEAQHCILAVPQFVACRLLNGAERKEEVKQHIRYVPWMVANLLVNQLEERSGTQAGWDNVLHGNETLGYVDATHQLLRQQRLERNLTCYLPLTRTDTVTERKKAQKVQFDEWAEQVFTHFEKVHPNIRAATEEIHIRLWGHAMAQPLPGWIHGGARKKMSVSLNNRVHFAHTDVAGISIFEEAFYQGINAAKKILNTSI